MCSASSRAARAAAVKPGTLLPSWVDSSAATDSSELATVRKIAAVMYSGAIVNPSTRPGRMSIAISVDLPHPGGPATTRSR